MVTRAEYREFAKKYDMVVLDAVKGRSWFNILHVHGEKGMFDQLLDYPVQALNYHDREAGPSLAEMRKRTRKCLMGGIAFRVNAARAAPPFHRRPDESYVLASGKRFDARHRHQGHDEMIVRERVDDAAACHLDSRQ